MYGVADAPAAPPAIPVNYPACPAGYNVPTFQSGLTQALGGMPASLFFGLLNLTNLSNPNTGNVLLPDGTSECTMARSSPGYVLGGAVPGLAIVAAVGLLLFGGKR
jgi:hypothetical protein